MTASIAGHHLTRGGGRLAANRLDGVSRIETGGKAGPTAKEILANVDAMDLAVEEASTTSGMTIEEITAIHRALMTGAPNSRSPGLSAPNRTGIGGSNYNPCGASFVSPPADYVPALLADLCRAIPKMCCRR